MFGPSLMCALTVAIVASGGHHLKLHDSANPKAHLFWPAGPDRGGKRSGKALNFSTTVPLWIILRSCDPAHTPHERGGAKIRPRGRFCSKSKLGADCSGARLFWLCRVTIACSDHR